MNEEHDFDPADGKLAEAIAAMKSMPVSEVPGELLEKTPWQISKTPRVRISLRRRITEWAIAASLLLVCGLVAWWQLSEPVSVFAQMQKKLEKFETFRGKRVIGGQTATVTIRGNRERTLSQNGIVETVVDYGTGESLVIDHRAKTAMRLTGMQGSTFGLKLGELFRGLSESEAEPIDDYVSPDGTSYPGLKGATKLVFAAGNLIEMVPVEVEVWTDQNTGYPVRIRCLSQESPSKELMRIEEMEFNVHLDEADFALVVPLGYREPGSGPLSKVLSEQEAAKWTIQPGIGVGEITFEMTQDEIIEKLGQPEDNLYGTYLAYRSLGIQFVAGPSPEKLSMITLNPHDLTNLKRHEFPGKTIEGIGIGSTRGEVIAAYGPGDKPPFSSPEDLSEHVLYYAETKTMYSLRDGKVEQIDMQPK